MAGVLVDPLAPFHTHLTPGPRATPPLRCTPTSGGSPRRVIQAIVRGVWEQESASGLRRRFGEGAVRDFVLAPPHPTLALRWSPVPHG